MDVNLEYYKIFYYVGKLGRITAAAEVLSISQPAVSQAIKHLETAAGIALFVRTPKGVKLTKEGTVLYHHVKAGYEQIKLGEKKLLEMLNMDMGEMKIGASDMTLQFYLLPYLEKFHEIYPNIKISVSNAPTPETLRYMETGDIDFGVISSPFHTELDLTFIPVRNVEDIFVAGSNFFYLKDKILDYAELVSKPLICLENNTSTREYVDTFLKKNEIVLNPEFELATSDMIVQFALRNFGIGSVVKDFAEKHLTSGELIQLEFKESIPKRKFYIVTNERTPSSTATARLLEMIIPEGDEHMGS